MLKCVNDITNNLFLPRMYKKFAFFHIQTVIPDTLGYALVDSPLGLISWIGEHKDMFYISHQLGNCLLSVDL